MRDFKNILITGASGGLGRALAVRYAAPGTQMGLLGRDEARLAETAALCSARGASVTTVSMDLSDRNRLTDWVATFDDTHPVDLVIANAGAMHAVRPEKLPEPAALIDETFATNFTGVLDTVNPLLGRMVARGGGHVAIIGSLSAYRGLPVFPAYAASKAALKSYYEALRGLYARQGVHISITCPGYIDTRMTESLRVNRSMLMGVETAAARIERGVNGNAGLITFPWHQGLGLQLLGLLPQRLADRILLAFFRL